MAVTLKISGANITEHFTWAEYSVNQTGTVKVTKEALLQARILEDFRAWISRSLTINAWYRTASYNKNVANGNANSSHLTGKATDLSFPGLTEEKFIKYAKKWKELCNKYGVVGEAGLYTWGMHVGSSVTYTKTFYHWDSRSGKQINKPFDI